MPETRESRPVASGPAGSISTAIKAADSSLTSSTDADDRPRCVICGHVITCEASIAAGIGRDCRRALSRALERAEPEVVTAILAGVAALSGVRHP